MDELFVGRCGSTCGRWSVRQTREDKKPSRSTSPLLLISNCRFGVRVSGLHCAASALSPLTCCSAQGQFERAPREGSSRPGMSRLVLTIVCDETSIKGIPTPKLRQADSGTFELHPDQVEPPKLRPPTDDDHTGYV